MADPSNHQISYRKKIAGGTYDNFKGATVDVHQPGPSSPQQEPFIPIAAKDSEWTGLSFYNPHFNSQQDYDEIEEEELQLIGPDDYETMPIYLMFPQLKDVQPYETLRGESTTTVTKLLLGQKADFSHIKPSKRVMIDNPLQAVPESPHEERYVSESSSNSLPPGDRSRSNLRPLVDHPSDIENYDVTSDCEEELQPKHKRMRKKLTDTSSTATNSSQSDVYLVPKRPVRRKGAFRCIKKTHEHNARSSQENFGDDEREN